MPASKSVGGFAKCTFDSSAYGFKSGLKGLLFRGKVTAGHLLDQGNKQQTLGEKGPIMNDLHNELKKRECKDRRCGKDRRSAADAGRFSGTDRRGYKDRRTGLKRRKHQRFQVEDFILVNLKSKSDKDIGQLIDISDGGLSFRYFLSAKKPKRFSKLDIVLSGRDFAITGLPFKIVSETDLGNGYQSGPISFRRYSAQFKQLTSNQNFKLCYFLYNYPKGRPS